MNQELAKLKPGAHVHLMGICGTAMGALAGILKSQGYKVTGSDQNIYPPMSEVLKDLNIEVMKGYKKENLSPQPDFVVVGNVISKNMEEAQALLSSDIPYTSFPKLMGDFIIGDRDSIVVAGTHGKTTTTSLMTWIAHECGKQPGYLVGGIPKNLGVSFAKPEQNLFIIEGDEYDTAFFDKVPKFIYYKPKYVLLTSIEFDHADIYNSIDEILESFKKLLELIPADGLLIYNCEDPNILGLLEYAKCKKIPLGRNELAQAQLSGQGGEFELSINDQKLKFYSKMSGDHNLLNQGFAISLALELGWPADQVKKAIASFEGVKRRQEVLGEPGGVMLIEDFAHHPTAVKLTLEGLKQKYPKKKLWAIFEPRSATSRRSRFQKTYIKSFLAADAVILAPPFNLPDLPQDQLFSSELLAQDINTQKQNKNARVLDVDEMVDFLKKQTQSGDLICLMSNGGFGGIYKKLFEALTFSSHSVPRT